MQANEPFQFYFEAVVDTLSCSTLVTLGLSVHNGNRRGACQHFHTNGQRMKRDTGAIAEFLREEDGPTSVEYAVMLALIVVVCLTAVGTVGTEAFAKFCDVADALAN